METWLLARKMIKWTLLYAKVARGFSDCNLFIHTYTVFWELQRVSCRLLVPFLREKPDMGIQAAVYEDITIYSHQEEVGMWPMDTYGIFELGILLGQKKLDCSPENGTKALDPFRVQWLKYFGQVPRAAWYPGFVVAHENRLISRTISCANSIHLGFGLKTSYPLVN